MSPAANITIRSTFTTAPGTIATEIHEDDEHGRAGQRLEQFNNP